MRQQPERVGGAGPGQRLAGQPKQVGPADEPLQYRAQVVGADALGHVAAPDRHVEIGMLAAEELGNAQAAEAAASERPKEQRRAFGAESDHDEGGDAGRAADVTLPEAEEIVALVGGAQAVALFERPPMRLGFRHILDDLDPRDAVVGVLEGAVRGGKVAEGKHIHRVKGDGRRQFG